MSAVFSPWPSQEVIQEFGEERDGDPIRRARAFFGRTDFGIQSGLLSPSTRRMLDYVWRNFVSNSAERIEQVKRDWRKNCEIGRILHLLPK